MVNRKTYGYRQEDRAANYLKEKGYQIIKQNHSTFLGELDIIAKKDGKIVFVEVKSKRDDSHGRPEDMITERKKKQLIKLAKSYIAEEKLKNIDYQIDVIAILGDNLTHYKSAIKRR